MELNNVIYREDIEDDYPKDECQFFIGSLIILIGYLHERNIVHRDIKPENCIIDEKGNFKLLDFGAAKLMVENRTMTQIGTPWYTAPEVIDSSGKGYNYAVDIWSIGVVMWEILTGYLPFGTDENDPYEIYKEILAYDNDLEQEIEDDDAFSLI